MHSTYSKGFIHWEWILIEVKEWKAPIGIDLQFKAEWKLCDWSESDFKR